MNKYLLLLLPIVGLIVGILIGFSLNTPISNTISQVSETREGQKKFINPLLDYKIPPSKELGPFRNILQEKVNAFINSQKASQIGVYYRDLNNGPWIGINERDKFVPASILKVPLMISYFKMAEDDPSILSKRYTFTQQDANAGEYFKPSQSIEIDKEYRVDELIRRMIVFSDNNAMNILYMHRDQKTLDELYNTLGIHLPTDEHVEDYMSPLTTSIFFRVLYNATYLNQAMSEKALELLAQTDFKKGIIKGIPRGTTIAQKFGETIVDNEKELHNCGIIYYPKHPYMLCIMTKGNNYEDLSAVIADISKFTYQQVAKSNK